MVFKTSSHGFETSSYTLRFENWFPWFRKEIPYAKIIRNILKNTQNSSKNTLYFQFRLSNSFPKPQKFSAGQEPWEPKTRGTTQNSQKTRGNSSHGSPGSRGVNPTLITTNKQFYWSAWNAMGHQRYHGL